jgi:hypothetical protein
LGVGGGGGAEGAGAGAATAAGVGEGAFWDVVVGGAEADTEGSSIFRGDNGAAAVFSAGFARWRTAFSPLPREEEATIVMLRPFHL